MSGAGNGHFCNYNRQQTKFERQKKLYFLLEMQSKITINWDNSSGTEYKIWGFWWECSLKTTKMHRNSSKNLYKQHMEWWGHLAN